MSNSLRVVTTITVAILVGAFFVMVTVMSSQYQQHQHDERIACIEQGGVFTDSGCTWSKDGIDR